MPFYENNECPVCKKRFEQDDDIVVCPECGTPHHRECYNFIGHCVNHGLHKNGYDYYSEHNENTYHQENDNIQNDNNQYYSPAEKKSADETNTGKHDLQSQAQSLFGFESSADSIYDNDNQTIDGEKMGDVAATVRTNVARFVSRFKKMEDTNKKTSWNWGAFFFGPYYLLFRKMYKQGILFLCINMAVSFAGSYALSVLAPKFTELMTGVIQNFYSNQTLSRTELMKSFMNCFSSAADGQNAKIIFIAMFIISLILRLIITILADYIYKGTVSSIIKKVKAQLDEGASFMQAPIMMNPDINLSQEQMKKMYLSKKGGISLLPPFIAYLIIYFLLVMI